MIPWQTLDRAVMNDGSELAIARRDREFAIRVDGQVLMNSESHGSEEKLATHGCAGLRAKPRARVLIGGLGMGFTARAALDELRPDARVDVAEIAGAVVKWNRDIIGHLAGTPLRDRRLRVMEIDVAAAIASAADRYDAILLDVDNGPDFLIHDANARIYRADLLDAAARRLAPGGTLALWCQGPAPELAQALRDIGGHVEGQVIEVLRDGRWLAYAIYSLIR
jgi:spermidine synthase